MKKSIMVTLLFAAFALPDRVQAQEVVRTYHCKSVNAAGVSKRTSSGTSINDTLNGVDTSYGMIDVNNGTSDSGSIRLFGDVIYNWALVPSITGTTTGTVIFQGSETGVFAIVGDWVTLISDVTQYNGSSSISISGASTTYGYFIIPRCQFRYVRWRFISAGSGQTSVMTSTVNIRPHS